MSTTKKDYYQRTNITDSTEIYTPIIPFMITPQSIITDRHNPTVLIPMQSNWYRDLCHTIVIGNTHVNTNPLHLSVRGKITDKGHAFQWELQQDDRMVMEQISSAPKIHEISLQTTIIIGIISCITKIQTFGWQNEVIVHTDTSTIQFINKKKHSKIDTFMNHFRHIQRLTRCQFIPCSNFQFDSEDHFQTASQNFLPHVSLPTSLITIYIKDHVVLNNLHDTIRQARHKKPVFDYLRLKYKWCLTTINLIDWTLHGRVLQINKHRRIFNIKYIHQWLPVATHGSMTPNKPTCLRCNREEECQDHWFTCPHDAQFHQEQYKKTSDFLQDSGLHTSLQPLVLRAMYGSSTPHTKDVQMVVNQQSAIGWGQFIRGRIALSWTTVQNKLSRKRDGSKILTKVMTHIFSSMYDTWTKRNNDIHGKDPSIQERYFQTFTVPRVIHLLNQKSLLPAHDQLILDFDSHEFLNQSHKSIEKWLDTNEAYLLQSIQRENSRLKDKNHNITKYFPVQRTPGNIQQQKQYRCINTQAKHPPQAPTEAHLSDPESLPPTNIPCPETHRGKNDLRPP
jgi:hypothetical protein